MATSYSFIATIPLSLTAWISLQFKLFNSPKRQLVDRHLDLPHAVTLGQKLEKLLLSPNNMGALGGREMQKTSH